MNGTALVNPKDLCRPLDNSKEVGLIVEVQTLDHTEPVEQRRGQKPGASRGSDQGETRQLQTVGLCARTLTDNQVQPVIFHSRVEGFLDQRIQPVDLVNEQHILFPETGEDGCQVLLSFDHRPGADPDAHPHLRGNDRGERGLAKARWAVEEQMVQRLSSRFGSLDENPEVRLDLLLADIVIPGFWAQALLEFLILVLELPIRHPFSPAFLFLLRRCHSRFPGPSERCFSACFTNCSKSAPSPMARCAASAAAEASLRLQPKLSSAEITSSIV